MMSSSYRVEIDAQMCKYHLVDYEVWVCIYYYYNTEFKRISRWQSSEVLSDA